ncbi:MAG: hypothetical protein HY231_12650 [Acidobacteria bacterium]|nr:hypothetical protein [Acidobacteriota bacterium]
MKCPNFERLLDYLDGNLTADEAARLAWHLNTGCAKCAANQNWYQQTRALAASDDMVEPPAWVTKRALRIFETQRPRLVERLGQALAALVFDSLSRPALAGARSTETSNRQLLYNAGDYSIDLQIAPSSKASADLVGQILREGETSFESVANLPLVLSSADKEPFLATTNRMGEFTISGIEQGIYDLQIETPVGFVLAAGVPVIQEQ